MSVSGENQKRRTGICYMYTLVGLRVATALDRVFLTVGCMEKLII